MKTIIELDHKNFLENIIVTSKNHEEVLTLIHRDKQIINYNVLQQGALIFDDCYDFMFKFKKGLKVGTIRSLEKRLFKMQQKTYFKTDKEANDHFFKIDLLALNIKNRTNQLTNIEKLYI